MAAINFPDAPTNGQIFESGGMSWTYVAGIGWTLNSAIVEAGSGFTFIGDTMPLPVNVGDTWFDSSTGPSGGTSWVAVEEGPAGASEKVWVQFAPGTQNASVLDRLPKGKVAANTWATDQGGFTNVYADISGSTLNHNFVAGRFYRYSFILPTSQQTTNAQQSFRVVGQNMADLSPYTSTAIVGYQNTVISWVQFSPNSSYNGNIWMRGYTSAGTMVISSGNVIRSQFLLEDLGLN